MATKKGIWHMALHGSVVIMLTLIIKGTRLPKLKAYMSGVFVDQYYIQLLFSSFLKPLSIHCTFGIRLLMGNSFGG